MQFIYRIILLGYKGEKKITYLILLFRYQKKVGAINMLISVDEKAVTWFAKEFDNSHSLNIRMFPQYQGFGQKHKGYSLAFSAEAPTNAGYTKEINGITFFIEGNDVWFFEDTKTYLSFNEQFDELEISFQDELAVMN
jgi:uncharacterized protein YneR